MALVQGPWKTAPSDSRPVADPLGGGDDGGMSDNERIAKLEAVIPTLATKADLMEMKSDLRGAIHDQLKWIVGTMLALGALALAIMTFILNNATPKAPVVQPPPIIINVPAPAPAAAPSAPAPAK